MSASALLACMAMVAQMFDLPPRLLPAIQAAEGGRVGAVRANPNGTEDLGLMQVNTVWLPQLAHASGLPPEELRRRLIHDGCFSIQVAGAILRMHLDAERGDLLRAIGNYHSRTPGRHEAYQERVIAAAIRLFGHGGAGGGDGQRRGR
ncbi:lytic transglycosylase domain-containing protein [Caldovatus aquaticus]|uniref:Lytic transglycosylase domain-containing protein n=1 Tax=Caldovatus aquaticus TaxID=2865671 RepID=A0ABS7F2G2_9PROT|nr:lytic transglycosylase domain-containing protein [Caldovatus aquaticus]MBW8269790.1 lytic transglycosylase domain-containing protein [Caldovatus aquaticus]